MRRGGARGAEDGAATGGPIPAADGGSPFYGPGLSAVHDAGFTTWARAAARWVGTRLEAAGHRSGRVTDLGCGSGVLLRYMAEHGFATAGVDRSAAMVDLARERVPAAELHVGSIYEYPIGPSVAVTAVGEVLNYLPAPEEPGALGALLRRIHEALEPRGLFVCDVLERRPGGVESLSTSSTREGEGWRVRSDARVLSDGSTLVREIRTDMEGRGTEREIHRCRLLDVDALMEAARDVGFRVERRGGYGDLRLPGPRSVLVAERPGPGRG